VGILTTLFLVVSCNNIPGEMLNDATRPTADSDCIAAFAHVRQCDARLPDREPLCSYSAGGECAPFVNAQQVECLRESKCDAVRAALDAQSWLCGVSLKPGLATPERPQR
jgi:hypothetical protein